MFDVSKPYPPPDFQGGPSKHSLALTRTCRQIYAETSLVAFATNTFYIDTWHAGGVEAFAFLAVRSTAELERIQSCFVCVGSLNVLLKLLNMIPNLHHLQMTTFKFCFLVSIDRSDIEVLYRQDARKSYARETTEQVKLRLQCWKPEAKLVMRNVQKLPGELAWRSESPRKYAVQAVGARPRF